MHSLESLESITKSISKIYSLNHHLESHLSKKTFSIFLCFPTTFLYLMHSLESHSHSLSLDSEKSRIHDVYIWISNWRACRRVFFFTKISIPVNWKRYKESFGDVVSLRSSPFGINTLALRPPVFLVDQGLRITPWLCWCGRWAQRRFLPFSLQQVLSVLSKWSRSLGLHARGSGGPGGQRFSWAFS